RAAVADRHLVLDEDVLADVHVPPDARPLHHVREPPHAAALADGRALAQREVVDERKRWIGLAHRPDGTTGGALIPWRKPCPKNRRRRPRNRASSRMATSRWSRNSGSS